MAKNYLIYPCKTLRITQSYTGTTSHLPHTTGNPKDYPWDEGCTDSGRDWCYCPCDEMRVKRIYGVGAKGTNTIWLESTTKVDFADGTKGYFTMLITHPNDDDLKKIKVGQTFKRKEKICREGIDGATGNHFHFSGGKGKYKGNGWMQNSKGKYVLTTTDKAYKPEQLFFVDKSFTKVVQTKGLTFKELPKDEPKKETSATKKTYTTGNYMVNKAEVLIVRKGAGTKYAEKTYKQLTKDARAKILKIAGYEANGYVKSLTFTVTKVKDNWGKTASGWVCLDYCVKIK
jgi:hypothetical protein